MVVFTVGWWGCDQVRRTLLRRPPTHFLFLATNCFFIRPGVEAFVGQRVASAAVGSGYERRINLDYVASQTIAGMDLEEESNTADGILIPPLADM